MAIEFEGIKFYSTKEVGEILKVTLQTVRAYINKGKLKGKKFGVGFYVSESSLKEFMQAE